MRSADSLRALVEAQGRRPASAPRWFLNPLAWCVLLALAIYQKAAPARLKRECRFVPSCSNYMRLAVRKYGVTAGVHLGWDRLRRCVGFVPAGEDWP
jgi:uncharacterized protein